MGDHDENCGKCKKKIINDRGVGCEGVCQKWFHPACVSISAPEMKLIEKNKQIKWMCEDCNDQYVHLIDTSVKKIMNEMMDTLKTTMEQMLTKKFNEMMKKNNMNLQMNQVEKKTVLYADRLKEAKQEVIILHPKNQNQTSDTTKMECKEKLNPAEMKVGIENVRKIRNGGIVITCKTKEEIKKINEEVKAKLGKEYEVKIPQLKTPKIRIYGIEEMMEDDDLIDALRNQNPEIIGEEAELTVKVNKRTKQTYVVVVETDPKTFKKVILEGKLKIKWQRCQVNEYLGISRCLNCYSYDHWVDECDKGKLCLRCGNGDGHEVKDCEHTNERCMNCVSTNEKLKLDLDVNHSVMSNECPVYLRRVSMKRRGILYDSI